MGNNNKSVSLVKVGLVTALLFGTAGQNVWAAPQASLTLKASNMQFCYKQQADWTLTNTKNVNDSVPSGTSVTWTVTATKTLGSKEICATGFVSVTNTGSAPATIGNIVVNLQREKLISNKTRWVSASADIADATDGDAAIQGNLVAAASQEDPSWNAVGNSPATYAVVGSQGTFKENSASGKLQFTDTANNTAWAITPAQTIPAGQTVNLYFAATFNNDVLNIATGESLRAEVIVSFGNSGGRGGSGASAQAIDVNGNTTIDSDEANVRSVPTRVMRALPALQVCNDNVTLTDELSGSSTAAYNVTSNAIGSGLVINASGPHAVVATVTGDGYVTNEAQLKGTDTTVQIQVGTDPGTGLPIYVERPCCVAVDLSASSTVQVISGTVTPLPIQAGDYCTYTQGGWGAEPRGNNPGQLLVNNFGAVYPSGVEVGLVGVSGFSMNFTPASAIAAYLPAGGTPSRLTTDLTNPTSSASGVFGGQVLALRLNVDFSDAHVTPLSPSLYTGALGDLKFASLTAGSIINSWTLTGGQAAALNGTTVRQVLVDANTALGGGALPAYVGTISNLNELATWLNEAFDNCLIGAHAADYLSR